MASSSKTIYLSIAGFNIKVVFEPLQITFYRKRLIRDINSVYKGFLLRQQPQTTDFVIHFDEPHHHFLTRKIEGKKFYFSYLFHLSDENNFRFTYDISLHQFSHLISNIIQKKLV